MKQKFILLASAVIVMAGCSKTETVRQSQGTAIDFTGAYIGNAVESRAVSEINKQNITEFTVYGGYTDMTHVFNGVQVKGTPLTDNWKYEGNTRYWVAGQNYKFAAYAPKEINGNGTISSDYASGHLTFKNYVSDATHQWDLLYDTSENTTSNPITSAPGKIQFVFNHLLSMIRFTFHSGFGDDIKVTINK